MFATKTFITNVTKVVRSKHSLNVFHGQQISQRLLREKEMRLKNVRREASKYVIEAAEKKAS